jgi:DNA invertase Pin-like site-specific DNA recombinase
MKTLSISKEQETKALLIARVSDVQQRKALPAQKLRLEEYAKRSGWEEDTDYRYIEFDETAFKGDVRREFEKQVVQRVKEATEKLILVHDKTDRFSRDTSDDQKSYLVRQTKSGKIDLHFPNDNLFIHKDSPATDWFRLDINVALASYYSASIRDNVKRKIELKLQRKEWPGKAPVGYYNQRIDEEHTDVLVDEERAEFVREAFELRRRGWSYRAIAKKLRADGFTTNSRANRPISTANIERILNNPFYYGVMRYNGKLYPHRYQPLLKKRYSTTAMKNR